MFDIQIIGIKFSNLNKYGDFNWMCKKNEYKNSLFIFNDNIEYHKTNISGGGNAIMRKYNKYSELEKPISAGIPTGSLIYGGYKELDEITKTQIDESFNEIINLINIHKYDKIYFSSELDGKLGTSIFEVNDEVINYITQRIFSLTTNPIQITKLLDNNYFNEN